jgi:hypothetical protein
MTLFTSLWMCLFFEVWKRREKLLAFNFGVLGTNKINIERRDHYGTYEVDRVNGEVIQSRLFNSRRKRMLVEPPLFLSAVVPVVVVTLLFQSLVKWLEDNNSRGEYTSLRYTIYTILASIAEAVSMITFNTIYDIICTWVVEWENHRLVF